MISIDPTSGITQEMVTVLATRQGVNEDVALGTLMMAMQGKGTLDAQIFDTEPVLKPVRDAYFAKNNVENAATSSPEGLAAAAAEEASGEAPSEATSE